MEAIDLVRKMNLVDEMTVGQTLDVLLELRSIMGDKSKFNPQLLAEMDESSQIDMFMTYISKSISETGKQLASIADA